MHRYDWDALGGLMLAVAVGIPMGDFVPFLFLTILLAFAMLVKQ